MRYLLIILCLPFIGLSQNIDKYNLDIARELGECYDKVVVDKETEISYPLCSDSTVRVFFLEPNYYAVYNESLGWCGSAGCSVSFYKREIENNSQVELKMLHFFINTGIKDNAYYWNELLKCITLYIELKKICPTLDSLNIGGGFPIKNSLAFAFDYEYMIEEIIHQIQTACEEAKVEVPDIFTEFGSFTVGESGGAIYEVLYQKKQNDRERWNIINSSFITTLPDSWAINKRFIMLPLNKWNNEYERVLLGGLTCDSDDYYNSEQHINAIYLPIYEKDKPLYIGFFNTGAYQESIGGFGGLQHCLIPHPKHIIIDKNKKGEITTKIFKDQQKSEELLSILGYEK